LERPSPAPDTWVQLPLLFLPRGEVLASMTPIWRLDPQTSFAEHAERLRNLDFSRPTIPPERIDAVARHAIVHLVREAVAWFESATGARLPVAWTPPVVAVDPVLLPRADPQITKAEGEARLAELHSQMQELMALADTVEEVVKKHRLHRRR
jgi:hypothetical protein